MHKLVMFAAAGLLSCSALAQPIYQWTDAQGRMQFGQLPPTNTPYQQVDIRAPAPLGGELRAPAPLPLHDSGAADQARTEQQRQQAAARELQTYCEQLRSNLTMLQDNPRLRRPNAQGEMERMTEEERQRLIQETRDSLQEYCQ